MGRLIRGVARTAVVAGTATAVSNRVSRRQAGRWAAQSAPQQAAPPAQEAAPQQAAPPAPSSPTMDQKLAQLEKLGELKNAGLLTDDEYAAQKQQILST